MKNLVAELMEGNCPLPPPPVAFRCICGTFFKNVVQLTKEDYNTNFHMGLPHTPLAVVAPVPQGWARLPVPYVVTQQTGSTWSRDPVCHVIILFSPTWPSQLSIMTEEWLGQT